MRVVLANFRYAADVSFFDATTGTFEKTSEHSWEDANGRFLVQDGSLVCFFRCRGEIHLYLDGINTTVDRDLKTSMEIYEQERCFRAFRGQELIYEKTYPRKSDTDGMPWWPSDAEDEDIFLWVHNIASSLERQQVFLAKAHS